MCISKATVILQVQEEEEEKNPQEEEEGEEAEEKEMSRDVSDIDWTSACPPSFINKFNLPRACGRCVSMTMSNTGTHPSNICEKLFHKGLNTQRQKTKQSYAQRITLNRYIVSIDRILRRPFATFGFVRFFFSAVAMFYKKCD